MLDQLRRVIVGQAEVIEQILAAIFTRGHCLLIGVPGLAKTLMVSSISQILDVSFKRILSTRAKGEPIELIKVLSAKAILNVQKLIGSVAVGQFVIDYVADLVRSTRPRDPSAPDFVKKMVDYGAGPRAGLALLAGGKAM